jgi:hypothetical protein
MYTYIYIYSRNSSSANILIPGGRACRQEIHDKDSGGIRNSFEKAPKGEETNNLKRLPHIYYIHLQL